MEKNKIVYNKSYYNTKNFLNNYLSSIIAIDNYFQIYMFPNDPSRIIYATNDFAFRQRLRTQSKEDTTSAFQVNSLDMPFFNFAITDISSNTDRRLKNNQLEKLGVMDWALKKKIRATPLKIDFEGTFFSSEEIDLQYLFYNLQFDDAVETTIKPKIQIGEEIYENYAYLAYNSINYNPTYTEKDWLEQNRIRTIGIDFSLSTYLIDIDDSDFWIPKSVLLGFANSKKINLEDEENYEVILEGVIDHIQSSVTF